MENIIVVDDHREILELLSYNLTKAGYKVQAFEDSLAALSHITVQNTDLVLTDWMMPKMDGLEFCKQLKLNATTKNIPVVMLTCKDDEIDIVTALELGAEDYIIKPFRIKELTTRLKKILKRSQQDNTRVAENMDQIVRHGIKIVPETHRVYVDNDPVEMTYSEFKLLELLAKRPGKVFSRMDIIEKINGENYFPTERSVDVQVVGLRKKLGPYKQLVETVRSVGYRFKDL